MNCAITDPIGAAVTRALLAATCLAAGGSAAIGSAAQAQTGWPADLVNPQPMPNDILLPMPCDGSMAFRRVVVPSADALDDRRVRLGSSEPRFAYAENTRIDYVGGGFTDPKTKNQRYYLIGKYEVTQLQFEAMSGACPEVDPEGRLPMTGISWTEAVYFAGRYADWLATNAADKLPTEDRVPGFVRLPTEAEWEFAARGGVSVPEAVFEQPTFPMAEGPQRYVWYAGTDSSNNELNGIGLLAPNPLGLHDILGNAGEFVLDPFRLNKHSRLHGQAGGATVKGGDFRTARADIHTAARTEYLPLDRNGTRRDSATGLRLVVVPGALPSAQRLQSVRALWGDLAKSGGSLTQQVLADPVKEVEALSRAVADPELKARIDGVGGVIKANIQARNEQRERSARSEIRVGAYLARKVVEDQMTIRAQERILGGSAPEDIKKQFREKLADNMQNLDGTLNYVIDTLKQIGLDFPGPTTTAQGEIVKREFEARAVPGYASLVDLVVRYSQAARSGKAIDKTALLADLAKLENKDKK